MRTNRCRTRSVVAAAETLLMAGLVPAFGFAAHAAGAWVAGFTVWATAVMIAGFGG